MGLTPELAAPVLALIEHPGPEPPAIRSFGQHDAILPWRRASQVDLQRLVTNLDGGQWARFPASFIRCRPDSLAEDCWFDQLVN